jgi:hypothetical protein
MALRWRVHEKKEESTEKCLAWIQNQSINASEHAPQRFTEHQSGCSSGVERNLAKVDVVGSNPIIRSIFSPSKTGFMSQFFFLAKTED